MNEWLVHKFNKIELNHWWWKGRRVLVSDLLKNSNFQSILDIGCGTGQTMLFMKQLFPKAVVEGVDNSPAALVYAKKNYHLKVYNQDIQKLRLPKKYDLIICLDVLEHIEYDSKTLKLVGDYLNTGGVLIVTTPALPFIWSNHDAGQGHFRRYTRELLLSTIDCKFWKIEKLTYFNFILSPTIIFVRLLSKFSMFSTLGKYDNKINYDLARWPLINSILSIVFWVDVKLAYVFGWPWGISLVAKLKKSG